MPLKLRGTKYHYRFQIDGHKYSGICPGCEVVPGMSVRAIREVERRAAQYEAEAKERAQQELQAVAQADAEVRRNRTVRALVENYRYELTGGKPIRINEAYDLAAAKPAKRVACARYLTSRASAWRDFSDFMAGEHPEVEMLADVRRAHCEAFVQFLVQFGRYNKTVTYSARAGRKKGVTSYERNYLLSAKTIRDIAQVCRWVFSRLDEDAGLITNPWNNVVLPAKDPTPREIFTGDELMLIGNGIQSDAFCRHLFIVAANSGMSEEDICLLKWSDIDWTLQGILRRRCKTGARITLPMLPELSAYLDGLPRTGEYVSEEHSRAYLKGQWAVTERVTSFLKGLGIQTTVQLPGRKAQSVKDLHSMRHVFCYRAKRAGVPTETIQKFVGHDVLEMTQHYADHDSVADLHQDIKKLPALFVGEHSQLTIRSDSSRRRLAELAYSLPEAAVEQLLAYAEGATIVNIA